MVKIGRPIEVPDEDVVRAGERIQADGREVNETRLWREVGKRGRPDRLLTVWTQHVSVVAAPSYGSLGTVAALPEAASRLLSECKSRLETGLDECVREIYAAVDRTITGRFRAEVAEMTARAGAAPDGTARDQTGLPRGGRGPRHGAVPEGRLRAGGPGRGGCPAGRARPRVAPRAGHRRGVHSQQDPFRGMAASAALTRAAEAARAGAEHHAEALQADLLTAKAALDTVQAAALDLERELEASRLTSKLAEAQLQQQTSHLWAMHSDLETTRERLLEQSARAATAEGALQALERSMAAVATDRRPVVPRPGPLEGWGPRRSPISGPAIVAEWHDVSARPTNGRPAPIMGRAEQ